MQLTTKGQMRIDPKYLVKLKIMTINIVNSSLFRPRELTSIDKVETGNSNTVYIRSMTKFDQNLTRI